MKLLTTLKQKDLSAVSAQQLIIDSDLKDDLQPIQIDRFQCYTISGNFNKDALLGAVQESYIFANPNKHHLIIENTNLLSPQSIYFDVERITPLHLNSKVFQLRKYLENDESIESVVISDLWGFKYPDRCEFDSDTIETIIERYVLSSSNNIAPFAHPMIHRITPYSFDKLTHSLHAS